jgi:hypothetical protein
MWVNEAVSNCMYYCNIELIKKRDLFCKNPDVTQEIFTV